MKKTSTSLRRWGWARMDYLKENEKALVAQMGADELYQHCLMIQEQAEHRKRSMMEAIRKNPDNKVTEKDKAADPMAWIGRINNFQAIVHETIYNDLIFSQ